MINAFTYSVEGQFDQALRAIAEDAALLAYRRSVLGWVRAHNDLEAILAFGAAARHAVDTWTDAPSVFVARLNHPSARPTPALLANWRFWLPRVRQHVIPDPDGDATTPNYGTSFRSGEQPSIPRADLPFGMPAWFGDRVVQSTRRRNGVISWTPPAGAVG
jgi:hypothetical protein